MDRHYQRSADGLWLIRRQRAERSQGWMRTHHARADDAVILSHAKNFSREIPFCASFVYALADRQRREDTTEIERRRHGVRRFPEVPIVFHCNQTRQKPLKLPDEVLRSIEF